MPASSTVLRAALPLLWVGCATPAPPPAQPVEPVETTPEVVVKEAWNLVPTSVQHQGNTLFVQAALQYTAGSKGEQAVEREREIFVGVTAVTSTGDEIDLAVTTFFPGHFQDPFTLSAEVGPDVQDVLFGVWDRKIEPCDSTRSGCKEFGFLLDGSLATWPPTVYVDGTRQRIPSGDLDFVVLDGGVGKDVGERSKAATEALTTQLGVFGMATSTTVLKASPQAVTKTALVVKHGHDVLVGRQLIEALELGPVEVTHNPDAEASFVLTLAGSHGELAATCVEHQDDAYLSCLGEH